MTHWMAERNDSGCSATEAQSTTDGGPAVWLHSHTCKHRGRTIGCQPPNHPPNLRVLISNTLLCALFPSFEPNGLQHNNVCRVRMPLKSPHGLYLHMLGIKGKTFTHYHYIKLSHSPGPIPLAWCRVLLVIADNPTPLSHTFRTVQRFQRFYKQQKVRPPSHTGYCGAAPFAGLQWNSFIHSLINIIY